MKKFICLLVACLSFGVYLSAQDVILKKDNSIILANIDEITDSEIVYHDFSNPDGPVYRVSKSNVSQVKFKNGKTENYGAAATTAPQAQYQAQTQYASPYTPQYSAAAERMSASRGDLYLGGRKLSDNEIIDLVGSQEFDEYESANRKRRAGLGLICAGAPVFAIGDVILCIGIYKAAYYEYEVVSYDGGNSWSPTGRNDYADRLEEATPFLVAGSVVSAAGIALLAAGIPCMITGNRRIDNVANNYNNKVSGISSVSFGLTGNGVGLAMKF